jgi:predicted secreted Zn-dependent protease
LAIKKKDETISQCLKQNKKYKMVIDGLRKNIRMVTESNIILARNYANELETHLKVIKDLEDKCVN